MNLTDMLTFVRGQADTDETDATTANLTVYARAAYREIQNLTFPWPDKATTFTFSSEASQPKYLFTSMTPATLEYIVSVKNSDDVLNWISMEDLLELQEGNGSTASGAQYFAADNNSIRLWPTPTTVRTYTIVGYREFVDWPSGSAEPDLPRVFDEAICWYMLSKYYLAQEDLELAQKYEAIYAQSVDNHIAATLRGSGSTAGPRVFGGTVTNGVSYVDWVRRNTEG